MSDRKAVKLDQRLHLKIHLRDVSFNGIVIRILFNRRMFDEC